MSPPLPRIRFIRPNLPQPAAWLPFLEPTYRQRQFTNRGPAVGAFEAAIAASFGAAGRGATVMCSATAGITASLQALGVRGFVACPAFTFPATLQAILAAGCHPWLCDVDSVSWELSPATIAQALDEKVEAVVHVRALGFCRDLSAMEEATRSAGVPLVVDAAACLGGRLPDGGRVGGQGTMEVFSLHATKPCGIGEGGTVFAAPKQLPQLIEVANFALRDGQVMGAGLNAKMSEFQAAVGLAVVAEFAERQGRRDALFDVYDRYAADSWGLERDPARGRPAGQCYPLRLPPTLSNIEVERIARGRGIELRSYYNPALHQVKAFARHRRAARLTHSAALSRQMICLPLYADLTDEEQAQIIEVVEDLRQHPRRPAAKQTPKKVSRRGFLDSALSRPDLLGPASEA